MDYEQKFKGAMSFLKDLRPHMSDYCKEKLDGFFPELTESEDDRIRKALIRHIKDKVSVILGWRKEELIAWLEKQGEQKQAYNQKYIAGVFEQVGLAKIARELANDNLTNALQYAMIELSKKQGEKPVEQDIETHDLWVYIREWNEKFGRLPKDEDELASCIDYVMKRQKPTEWSEEDRKHIDNIISLLNQAKERFVRESGQFPSWITEILWLKSLKPRWKPTKEQIEALKYFISFHRSQANAAVGGWKEFKNLESLYNDLKKL